MKIHIENWTAMDHTWCLNVPMTELTVILEHVTIEMQLHTNGLLLTCEDFILRDLQENLRNWREYRNEDKGDEMMT